MSTYSSPIKRSSTKKDVPLDPNEVKGIHQFILKEKLGQGTFGKVRLGVHIITGEKVAIKILEKDKIFQQEDKDRVEKEIKILKMIRHNNLIQLYQVIQSPKLIYLVMEYSPGKDLFTYIVNNKKIKEDEACMYFQQIIEGVDYCQKLKICHRDLKPENLLLEGKTLKLIDFGLSNICNKQGKLSTACGSPSYAAPEMILGEGDYYGSRVDIWSCGVILYVMLCGFLPFEDTNTDKLYKKIIEGKYALPSFVSEPCKDLIKKIMNIDQEKRYTILEIKNHPWYKFITPKINEGLLHTKIVLPTDEDVIIEMMKKGFNTKDVRESIIMNKHNHFTVSYYLLVKSKTRMGIESESDLFSEKYVKYVQDEINQLSKYNNDPKQALEERLKEASKKEKEYESNIKDGNLNRFLGEDIVDNKIAKAQESNSKLDSINLIEENKNKVNVADLVSKIESRIEKKLDKFSSKKLQSKINPFEVNPDIKNSVNDIDYYKCANAANNSNMNRNDPNTYIIETKIKNNRKYNTAYNSPNKSLRICEIIDNRSCYNKPRSASKYCSFDATNINCIKEKKNFVVQRYNELKERVKQLKKEIKQSTKSKKNKVNTTTANNNARYNNNLVNEGNYNNIIEANSFEDDRKSKYMLTSKEINESLK